MGVKKTPAISLIHAKFILKTHLSVLFVSLDLLISSDKADKIPESSLIKDHG